MLCFDCLLSVIPVGDGVLCLFHTVPLVGLQDAGGGGGGTLIFSKAPAILGGLKNLNFNIFRVF